MTEPVVSFICRLPAVFVPECGCELYDWELLCICLDESSNLLYHTINGFFDNDFREYDRASSDDMALLTQNLREFFEAYSVLFTEPAARNGGFPFVSRELNGEAENAVWLLGEHPVCDAVEEFLSAGHLDEKLTVLCSLSVSPVLFRSFRR